MEGADVGMIEAGNGLSFAFEALFARGIGGEVRGKNFHGHSTIETSVAGAVDVSHAAGAERGKDFVRAELGAGGDGHGAEII